MDQYVRGLAEVDRLGDRIVRGDLRRMLKVPCAGLEIVGRQIRNDLFHCAVFQLDHRHECPENFVDRLRYGRFFGENVSHQRSVSFAFDEMHHGRLRGRCPQRGELTR